jgi:hypothetical protein
MMVRHLSVVIVSCSIAVSLTPAFAQAQTFSLCKGEHWEKPKNKCDPYEVYADCGKNSEVGEAVKRCRAFGSSGTPELVK